MSEGFLDSEFTPETASGEQPHNLQSQPAALAVSADDFASLEERVLRAVELLKRERQAREAAEAEKATLQASVAEVEAQVEAQTLQVNQLQSELHALRTEREQVKQRVERLLKQLDALEL